MGWGADTTRAADAGRLPANRIRKGERAIYDPPPVTQLVIQELRQTRNHVERTAAEHGEVEGWRVVPVATSSEASVSIYIGHCTGDMPLILIEAVRLAHYFLFVREGGRSAASERTAR